MRTAAVSELITPLKNPIVTGLSMNEILIFSKLSAEELADLASYRCITKQRTILHRIVMIGDELESNGQVKEQFFENLKHLFQNWNVPLTEKDAEKLTIRALESTHPSFVKSLITCARAYNLCLSGIGVFELPRAVATFVDCSDKEARINVCMTLGINVPSASMIKELSRHKHAARASLPTVLAQNATPEVRPEEELQLIRQQYALSIQERDLLQRKLQRSEQERIATATELTGTKEKLAAAEGEKKKLREQTKKDNHELQVLQNELALTDEQLMEARSKTAEQLATIETGIAEQDRLVKQAIEERAQHQQEVGLLTTRGAALEKNLDKANHKVALLEQQQNTYLEEITSLELRNTQLTSHNSDLRRKNDSVEQKLAALSNAVGFFRLGIGELDLADPTLGSSQRQDERQDPAAASSSNVGLFAARSTSAPKRPADDDRADRVGKRHC